MKFLASFVQIMMLLLLSIVVMVWQQMITISPAVLLQWQSANQTVTVCEIADINSSTQEICLLDILFHQITTFIKVRLAFVFGLQ